MATTTTTMPTAAQLAAVANDDRTPLGLTLPHPANSARVDALRMRAAIIVADGLLAAIPDKVAAALAASIGSAPATLDTIRELAAALGDDPNFAATVMAAIGAKASPADIAAAVAPLAPKASPAFTGNPTAPTPLLSDNDTSIATTAFAQALVALCIAKASIATTAEVRQAAADKVVEADNLFAAFDYVAVTFAASIALDGNAGPSQKLAATGNFTLAAPVNLKPGVVYTLEVTSSGAARTMSFAAAWRFPGGIAPTLTQVAGAIDEFAFKLRSDGSPVIMTSSLNTKAP